MTRRIVEKIKKTRKRILIPAVGLALATTVVGYSVPSYIDCKNSDIGSHKQTDSIDAVVIWGGDSVENALNGYTLARLYDSFVISAGNKKELAVDRKGRKESNFPQERVIELDASTTLGGVVDVYNIAKERGFYTMANVSAENHLKSVETLNGRLPKDIEHAYHPTRDWDKFNDIYATVIECTPSNTALRTANYVGGRDSLLGKKTIGAYELVANILRRIASPIFGGN